ncbi:MAG TPA: S41 family peptidase [Anaeromyxobacter sp.]|nr:S41 family peptidase [Anaeromyxobacter sp.]
MKRFALVLALAVTFFAGLTVDHVAAAAARRAQPYRALDVFARALESIENVYVEPVQEQDLVYGAIDGMVARLDPHSAFYRPEAYRQVREETAGVFDGVGLELSVEAGLLTVVSPMADSPAEKAGIRPGDRVVSIDQVSTRDMPLADATRRLRGPAGSAVVVEVMREGFESPQRLSLLRDRVHAQSVEWRVLDADRGYLYLRVKSFQERTDSSAMRALDEGRAAVHGEIRGMVLDLRNNPGGLVDPAVRLADLFLPAGIIVVTEGRDKRDVEVRRAHEKGTEPGYPLIVLVNRGTASASEIVAGALQDNGRAVILGSQTFGKGSVQTIIEMDDGSGLKLTTARYYTPHHRSIQEQGITPDVLAAETAPPTRPETQPAERDLKNHLRNDSPEVVPTAGSAAGEGDYPLRMAIDYLKAVDIFKASIESGRGKGTTSRRD